MIFLILIAIIAAIVTGLNIYDNSNLQKIKEYFEAKNCTNIIYSKGSYKAICQDKIIQIQNSFSVDIKNDKTIFELYKIKTLDKKSLTIIINKEYKIEFKEMKNLDNFYKALEEKVDI